MLESKHPGRGARLSLPGLLKFGVATEHCAGTLLPWVLPITTCITTGSAPPKNDVPLFSQIGAHTSTNTWAAQSAD